MLLLIAVLTLPALANPKRVGVPPVRGMEEVPHSQVDLRGGVWSPRLKTHHGVTVKVRILQCLVQEVDCVLDAFFLHFLYTTRNRGIACSYSRGNEPRWLFR